MLRQRQIGFDPDHRVNGALDQHLSHRREAGVHPVHRANRNSARLQQLFKALHRCGARRQRYCLAREILDGRDPGILAREHAVGITAFGVHGVRLEREAARRGDDGWLDPASRPIHLTRRDCLVALYAADQGSRFHDEAVLREEALLDRDHEGRLGGAAQNPEPDLDRLGRLRVRADHAERACQQHHYPSHLGLPLRRSGVSWCLSVPLITCTPVPSHEQQSGGAAPHAAELVVADVHQHVSLCPRCDQQGCVHHRGPP